MGKVYQSYLNSDRIYTCSACHTHLAVDEDIISKNFQGRHGKAYLISNVVNVSNGKEEDRILMTGLHSVADIFCNVCQTVIGWKYLYAFEEREKYKEGKYILEKQRIAKESNWQDASP